MAGRVLAASVPVRPAATVMLVRDGRAGLEVFMLRRTGAAAFARHAYVFPGGRVDDADHAAGLEPVCDENDAVASARLGLASGGLAWLVAAVRECFEEAGVLLARMGDSTEPIDFDTPALQDRFAAARHAVHGGSLSLAELCAGHGLRLLTDRIHLVDHWITPVGESRRFDTRFFLTRAPAGQEPLHDELETVASVWVRPLDALDRARAGEWRMLPPTATALRALSGLPDAEAAVAWAETVGVPAPILPRLVVTGDNRFAGIVRPDEEGYFDTPLPEWVIEQR